MGQVLAEMIMEEQRNKGNNNSTASCKIKLSLC